jgi:hypothetical protein
MSSAKRGVESSANRKLSRNGPGGDNGDLLEADFRPASLRVHPGHNFRFARDLPGAAAERVGFSSKSFYCSKLFQRFIVRTVAS